VTDGTEILAAVRLDILAVEDAGLSALVLAPLSHPAPIAAAMLTTDNIANRSALSVICGVVRSI
jgi:hypothetical protein